MPYGKVEKWEPAEYGDARERQMNVLELLEQGMDRKNAMASVGLSMSAWYKWRSVSKMFAAEADRAMLRSKMNRRTRHIPERSEGEMEEDVMRLAWAALNEDNNYAEKIMSIYRRDRDQLEDLCLSLASSMATLFFFDSSEEAPKERLAIWGPNGDKAIEGS